MRLLAAPDHVLQPFLQWPSADERSQHAVNLLFGGTFVFLNSAHLRLHDQQPHFDASQLRGKFIESNAHWECLPMEVLTR